MSAAVQGPPPGLAPHGLPPPGPAMAALMGGPPPLQHLGSRQPPPTPQHLHRPLDPEEVPGPPNPDVLLALLSRNKTLEGTVLRKYAVEIWLDFLLVSPLQKYKKTIIRRGLSM
jgi:hypothetical protein